MKKLLFFIILASFTVFAFVRYGSRLQGFLPTSDGQRNIPLTNYRIIPTSIGINMYYLYVADTEPLRVQGLSNVVRLKSEQGMIFNFPNKDRHSFWMKDMRFHLDFIYLDNNEVVDVRENISPNTYPAVITPDKPCNNVIELRAGEIQKSNIQIGDFINTSQ